MAKTVDNPILVSRLTSMVTGEGIQIIQHGHDDYEAYWTQSDCSVRGTLAQILDEIWEG